MKSGAGRLMSCSSHAARKSRRSIFQDIINEEADPSRPRKKVGDRWQMFDGEKSKSSRSQKKASFFECVSEVLSTA